MARLLSGRLKLLVAVCAALAAVAVFGWPFAVRYYLDQSSARGETTLKLAVSALDGHMRRFEPLPALLSEQVDLRRLTVNPSDARLRATANGYLKSINTLLGSSDIYLMTPDGETIAASNFDASPSFVGENFSYRPYFQDAMRGKSGRFFALGTTSLKRGYYFSAPVLDGDSVLGVIVFKVDLDQIENSWPGGDYEIVVNDPDGIVFMSSRSEWMYSSLLPLTAERMSRIGAWRRYANAPLRQLPLKASSSPDGRTFMEVHDPGKQRHYLVQSESMPEAGWTINVLTDTRSAYTQATTSTVAVGLLVALAGLAGAIVLQRRMRLAERLEMQRSAQEQLERRVEERTADLAAVNHQLEQEVAERRAAEQQLRQTQSDLIQAGKLAALGQMSAALSHEFNQPLAALKTYAENSVALIERDRVEDARDNLARISSLADRMSSISRHLRNFAREPNQSLGPVRLAATIGDALEIVTPRLRAVGASVSTDIEPPDLSVIAGSVRLQQVLVNLLSNAADAVERCDNRMIEIVARGDGSKVSIGVRDHGPGVAETIRDRIFDPFFSSKGVGKGLGLGLSISYNIVKDFGGELSVDRHPEGGAVFTVVLKHAETTAQQAAE